VVLLFCCSCFKGAPADLHAASPAPTIRRGYECKEPEPGKLTLAFRHLEDALSWACALQTELLAFAWPETGRWWRCCQQWATPGSLLMRCVWVALLPQLLDG
jgi:hypothetical protein